MSSNPADTIVRPHLKPRDDTDSRRQPPYHVVLIDDDEHTYDYVIEMCQRVFGYPLERGFKLARQVDSSGRVVLLTTTKEHAELKREQVLSCGADWRLERSEGPMTVVLEPAEDQ